MGRQSPRLTLWLPVRSFGSISKPSYQIVELTGVLLACAMFLAETYALQLAAALAVNALCTENDLPPLNFVSADGELNALAAGIGLAIENPNNHV